MAYKDPTILAEPINDKVAHARIDCNNCQITLFAPSGCDDGAFYPASDINIYGEKAVENLRDFCIKVLKERELHKQEAKSNF